MYLIFHIVFEFSSVGRIIDFNNSRHQSEQETEPRASRGALLGTGVSLPRFLPSGLARRTAPQLPTASVGGVAVSFLFCSFLLYKGMVDRHLMEEEPHPESIIRSYCF